MTPEMAVSIIHKAAHLLSRDEVKVLVNMGNSISEGQGARHRLDPDSNYPTMKRLRDEGKSYQYIADTLGFSMRTIYNHLSPRGSQHHAYQVWLSNDR